MIQNTLSNADENGSGGFLAPEFVYSIVYTVESEELNLHLAANETTLLEVMRYIEKLNAKTGDKIESFRIHQRQPAGTYIHILSAYPITDRVLAYYTAVELPSPVYDMPRYTWRPLHGRVGRLTFSPGDDTSQGNESCGG
jgi:hypothetical protein